METLKEAIMNRDGLSSDEANDTIQNARAEVFSNGADPIELLYEEFGLEPDYVFDLLEYC